MRVAHDLLAVRIRERDRRLAVAERDHAGVLDLLERIAIGGVGAGGSAGQHGSGQQAGGQAGRGQTDTQ
ncbi:hypothetical protein D3C71_1675510 [compost metagenome]